MHILLQISDKAKYLLEAMQAGESPSQVVSELMNSNAAVKITGRIHLFTLLFEVCKNTLRFLILTLCVMPDADSFL
jgi:hypothetical protein